MFSPSGRHSGATSSVKAHQASADEHCCQFQRMVDQFFHDFSRLITNRPLYFLILPILLSCSMATVLYLKRYQNSALKIFTKSNSGEMVTNNLINYLPENSDSVKHFKILMSSTKKLRNSNYNNNNNNNEDHQSGDENAKNEIPATEMNRKLYDWSRQPFAYVILVDNTKKANMLTGRNLKVARDIVNIVENIQVQYKAMNFTWLDICQRNHEDQCLEHPFISILRIMPSGSWSNTPKQHLWKFLQYPQVTLFKNNKNVTVDNTLIFGSVIVNESSGQIKSAAALRLPFLLQYDSYFQAVLLASSSSLPPQKISDLARISLKWQRKFIKILSNLKHPKVNITFLTSISLNDEIAQNGKLLIDYLPIGFCLLVTFSCFCCSHVDWVMSQPFLGLFGVLTAAQAIVVALGILALIDFPFVQMIYIMPFLVLSVSADNAFLVLNAWRNTHPLIDVKHRMSKAVGGTSVSIMITALTDGFSFAVGTISQFPAVRMFCTYCALAILCSFIYQMTFFVSCLSLSAKREMTNRHCLCLWRVHPRAESTNKSIFYQTCCAGGYLSRHEKVLPNKLNSSPMLDFFVERLSNILGSNCGKFLIILLYICYLCSSLYGLLHLKIGLQFRHLVPYESYLIEQLDATDQHFSSYGSYATVVIDEKIDYSDTYTIHRLLDLYRILSKTQFSDPGEFWLIDYLEYNASDVANVDRSNDIFNSFLNSGKFLKYKDDIIFDAQSTSYLQLYKLEDIRYMKFYIRLRNVGNINKTKIAEVLKRTFSKFGFSGFVYNPDFVLIDQQDATLQCLVQDVLVTVAIMILITFLFIPKFLSAFWIGMSILSINIGVLGYLSIWNVYLDIVSMLTCLMSVGLSVDYVAHVTYYYLAMKATDSHKRMQKTLHHVLLPANQSAVSTILGVAVLGLVESYMVRTFVKTVVLVVTLGLTHGLLFLPVSLSFFIPVDQYIDSFASNYGRVREYMATNFNFATYIGAYPPVITTARSIKRRFSDYFNFGIGPGIQQSTHRENSNNLNTRITKDSSRLQQSPTETCRISHPSTAVMNQHCHSTALDPSSGQCYSTQQFNLASSISESSECQSICLNLSSPSSDSTAKDHSSHQKTKAPGPIHLYDSPAEEELVYKCLEQYCEDDSSFYKRKCFGHSINCSIVCEEKHQGLNNSVARQKAPSNAGHLIQTILNSDLSSRQAMHKCLELSTRRDQISK